MTNSEIAEQEMTLREVRVKKHMDYHDTIGSTVQCCFPTCYGRYTRYDEWESHCIADHNMIPGPKKAIEMRARFHVMENKKNV